VVRFEAIIAKKSIALIADQNSLSLENRLSENPLSAATASLEHADPLVIA
jgi:hypothetical protein